MVELVRTSPTKKTNASGGSVDSRRSAADGEVFSGSSPTPRASAVPRVRGGRVESYQGHAWRPRCVERRRPRPKRVVQRAPRVLHAATSRASCWVSTTPLMCSKSFPLLGKKLTTSAKWTTSWASWNSIRKRVYSRLPLPSCLALNLGGEVCCETFKSNRE